MDLGSSAHRSEEARRPRPVTSQAFREVFNTSTNAMLLADDERWYVDANDAACRLLGASREDLLQLRIDDLTAYELRSQLDGAWQAFLKAGHETGHYELLTPAGDRLKVAFSATANVQPGRHLVIFITPLATGSPSRSEGAPIFKAPPTAREKEILRLLALGRTGEEIASQLSISPETVRNHIRNVREKLGAKTRAQAIAIALSQGLIRG